MCHSMHHPTRERAQIFLSGTGSVSSAKHGTVLYHSHGNPSERLEYPQNTTSTLQPTYRVARSSCSCARCIPRLSVFPYSLRCNINILLHHFRSIPYPILFISILALSFVDSRFELRCTAERSRSTIVTLYAAVEEVDCICRERILFIVLTGEHLPLRQHFPLRSLYTHLRYLP